MTTTADLLARLHGVKHNGNNGWLALCPGHDDREPSLSIKEADGKILLHCHAGCQTEAVVEHMGLTMSDLSTDGTVAELERLASEVQEYKPRGGFNLQEYAITHDDLLSKKLEPLDYLVEGLLITPGTAVLAGRKKIGKSWMALQLGQSIAGGAPFLEKGTRQGDVLYLALEDGERRLKQRLEMQRAARKLPITYLTKSEPLNTQVGFEAFREWIRAKHPALVVIDTLASAKNRFIKENEAGPTADLFNRLHDLAITENTVIVIVAHHGKASYGDPGFDIRGSSAIPGATDTNLGLYKNADGTFDLKAEGRDIGEVDLRISFDAELTWCWQCQGDARDVRRAEVEDRIIEALDLLGGEAEAATIAHEINVARATVSSHLKRMREQGKVGYKVVNTGKARKIIYTSPTNPTNQTVGEVINKDSETNHPQSVGSVGSVGSADDTLNTPEAVLGMPVEKAIEFWRKQGAPVIHLGPGDNCFDLAELLSRPDVPGHHLEAVRAWLEKVLKRRGKS